MVAEISLGCRALNTYVELGVLPALVLEGLLAVGREPAGGCGKSSAGNEGSHLDYRVVEGGVVAKGG